MLKTMKNFKTNSSTELSDDNIFGDEMGFNETPINLGTPIKTFSLGNIDNNIDETFENNTNLEDNANLKDNKQNNINKEIDIKNNTKDTINKENGTVKKTPNLNTKETSDVENKQYSPRGLTTPIDGEMFNIKRSYQFRESTLRKLTELKLIDPDINIYLNQIIDKAICFYYDYVTNKDSDN